MSCTAARRQRRLAEVQAKVARTVLNQHLNKIRTLYKENPNKALEYCESVVGKQAFEESLKYYLSRHFADTAFVLAFKHNATSDLLLKDVPKRPEGTLELTH